MACRLLLGWATSIDIDDASGCCGSGSVTWECSSGGERRLLSKREHVIALVIGCGIIGCNNEGGRDRVVGGFGGGKLRLTLIQLVVLVCVGVAVAVAVALALRLRLRSQFCLVWA